MTDIADMARAFSEWLNGTYPAELDAEAWFHRRIGKIHEEAGEVREATGAYWGENPRKERGSLDDVIKELADCVGAALGAIEHLTGHEGRSLDIATDRVRFVCERVGVEICKCPCGRFVTLPVASPTAGNPWRHIVHEGRYHGQNGCYKILPADREFGHLANDGSAAGHKAASGHAVYEQGSEWTCHECSEQSEGWTLDSPSASKEAV